jgi:hypothetical protein
MSNFIDKAKDLYFSDTSKYKDIGKTLELIEKFSLVKNYMAVDLHNIEDLLSIAYMESAIKKNSRLLKDISAFIKTVIEFYTSDVTREAIYFAQLVANLGLRQGSTFIPANNNGVRVEHFEMFPNGKNFKNTNFGIVSLNYDLIIEKSLSFLAEEHGKFYSLTQRSNILKEHYCPKKSDSQFGVSMAKLHGSIDAHIVPPTWNKNVNDKIQQDWKLAASLLVDATHLIFIGYSLPSTDNYIKYLLASSLNQNKRLKRISVINRDSDGQTVNRYKSLFTLSPRFHDVDTLLLFRVFRNTKNEIDFDLFDETFSSFCRKEIGK